MGWVCKTVRMSKETKINQKELNKIASDLQFGLLLFEIPILNIF